MNHSLFIKACLLKPNSPLSTNAVFYCGNYVLNASIINSLAKAVMPNQSNSNSSSVK